MQANRKRVARATLAGVAFVLSVAGVAPAGAVTVGAPYQSASCTGFAGEDSLNQLGPSGTSSGWGGASASSGSVNVHTTASNVAPAGAAVEPPIQVGSLRIGVVGWQAYTYICRFTQIINVSGAGTRSVSATFDGFTPTTTNVSASGIPVHALVSAAESRADITVYAASFACSPGSCAASDQRSASAQVIHTDMNSGKPMGGMISASTPLSVTGSGHVYVEAHLVAQSWVKGRWSTSVNATGRLRNIVVTP